VQHNDSDSGVANSDNDMTPSDSGSSLNNTPPQQQQQQQQQIDTSDDVVFNNEHSLSTSSTV